MPSPSTIRYRIAALDIHAHLFEVSVTVEDPAPDGQAFTLPTWIPGSYLVREFARHFVSVSAHDASGTLEIRKAAKSTWQVAPASGAVTVVAQVYAFDLSVRAAYLDATRAYFNGAVVFLRPEGRADAPCTVDLVAPADPLARGWRVATTLARVDAPEHGFGRYGAASYDELIDHPVEASNFDFAHFAAGGRPHEIAITGRHGANLARLTADLARVCQWQVDLFGEAPFDRYLFQVTAVGDGYGGLEHRSSTSLICRRDELPHGDGTEIDDDYLTFLGLASHEYFHAWNVKRIKPAAFVPYRLADETYTPLLWLFEGFTSYYDDLVLVRSGCVTEAQYVEMLGKTWNGVLRGNGRTKQSVAESSFDAWTKYYRQDENAPNAIVSYYTKGSLVALALDLTIRAKSRGRRSLDDVMRALWRRYGRGFYAPGAMQRGVTEPEVYALFDDVTGLKLGSLLRSLTEGTGELPLAALFRDFGVKAEAQKPSRTAALGIKVKTDDGWVRVTQVLDGGAAQAAGLSAGDLLVAIDGLRVAPGQVDKLLGRYRTGDRIDLHAFRRDELQVLPVTLAREPAAQFKVKLADGRHAARSRWLGQ